MYRDRRQYHWAERWKLVHHPAGSYMRRRTDGTEASDYLEAAEIEAAERGITRSQFLKSQKYKWLTLAEITPPVVSTIPEVPTATANAEVVPSPASPSAGGETGTFEEVGEVKDSPPSSSGSFDTTQPIRNAHYHRTDVMTAQISIGFGLMVLGALLALLSGLPILLALACAILGGALLRRGLSNRR